MFSDSLVQALVLFPHYEPVARREVVEVHRDLYHGPVQCQENLQHRLGVAFTGGWTLQSTAFQLVLLRHQVHSESKG